MIDILLWCFATYGVFHLCCDIMDVMFAAGVRR